jgi:flagellar motor protein MotB
LFVSGCATRYQDLLRDKDMEIRQLESRLADARAENDDLRRQKDAAEARLAGSQVQPVEAGVDGELDRIRGELPDLDVRRDRGRISIGIENTVTFDSGSIALKSSASSVLDRVARVLREQYPGRRIYVEGHTDTDPLRRTKGTYRSNRHLSVERADAVATHLIQKGGIPEREIVVVGYGPYEPRDPGNNDSAKARNRRVEIVVGESI